MPTIELVSIGAPSELDLPKYESFDYCYECRLEGHRGLFQHRFDQLEGVILHLGNQGQEGGDGWFAGMLMNWDREDHSLVFQPHVSSEVRDLLLRLLEASPSGDVTFSSDYQFGPEDPTENEVQLSPDRF